MELLTIRHTDFTMSIECGKFEAIWAKAMRHIGEQGLFSTYSWSEGVMAVTRMTEEGEQEIAKGEVALRYSLRTWITRSGWISIKR